jgi:hypothetical protein
MLKSPNQKQKAESRKQKLLIQKLKSGKQKTEVAIEIIRG